MKTLSDQEALDRIAAILSGKEWDADTTVSIAELVCLTGRGQVKDFEP